MSKTAVVFFSLVLVLASCFIAGCSSLPFSGSSPAPGPGGNVNVGLAGHNNPVPDQRYQLKDTISALKSDDVAGLWNDTPVAISQGNESQPVFPEKHIRYIRGTNLDQNGDAASWTFIVEHGDTLSIATFSIRGLSVSNSAGTINRPEIFPDQILSPHDLFEKNHAAIFNTTRTGTTVQRDLTLSGGYYTVSVSGQGPVQTLVFDAKTGAMIRSND
jgi:hypothetical protein